MFSKKPQEMANKNLLTVTAENKKSWKLVRGKMDFNFNVDTEIKTDMLDLIEIFETAIKLLNKEIEKYDKLKEL